MTHVVRDAKEYAGLCRYCEKVILHTDSWTRVNGEPWHLDCLDKFELDGGIG